MLTPRAAWVARRPSGSSVLIGASRAEQVVQNVASPSVDVTPDQTDRLEQVTAPPSLSMCGGNDEKSWGWLLVDIVSIGRLNNRNRSNAVLATRDHSFRRRASSPHTLVGIVQGRSTVSAA